MTTALALAPPRAVDGQVVEAGPERLRHELAWIVRLPDGRRALLAQLVPELAAEASLRRRWVLDAERMRDLAAPSLAPTLAIGPAPDPRDPAAAPPWRLRLEPEGTRLDAWLARAPLPVDEALATIADVADAVHAVHIAGGVLRDLEPHAVALGAGRVWLTDVGQARLTILSSRTASSLLLERSPWAAPEALRRAVVDARADVYTLGVMLWRALTGTWPHGDDTRLVPAPAPPLDRVRAGLPDGLAALVARCLDDDPARRPATARELSAALRGEGGPGELAVALVTCQACGQPLRAGLRLCLSCGKQAVRFRHVAPGTGASLVLTAAKEDEAFLAGLREFFGSVAAETPHLNFLVGDRRMYDKAEREARHDLPAPLLTDLADADARELAERLRARGYKVSLRPASAGVRADRVRIVTLTLGGATAVGGAVLIAAGTAAAGIPLIIGGAAVAIIGAARRKRSKRKDRPALARLRAAPAALPASDPLVARLAELLATTRSADVRAQLEELALRVQRLCDRRAELAGAGAVAAAELDRVTAPVAPLVDLVARIAGDLAALDRDLDSLDEGALVRALAQSEARREPPSRRAPILEGLDRLRSLEDRRAALLGRLLEAGSLIRRAAELGLARAAAESDAELQQAVAALTE